MSIAGALLNPKNFRHGGVVSQEEYFQALLAERTHRDYIAYLADDIAEWGLDPTSIPLVVGKAAHGKCSKGIGASLR